jgi:hypothetical protein
MNMKLIYGLLWMLLGIGLTLGITSDVHSVRQVGIVMVLIVLLARLFLYLRSIQPARDHFAAYDQPLPVLDLSTPANSLQPASENIQESGNRTPVERLLADGPAEKNR